MVRIVKVKNNTAADATWVGQTIIAGAYYTLNERETSIWITDNVVFSDIGAGNLIVNDGTDDITDSVSAWSWLLGDTMPKSELGNKLAIHSSTKPAKPGKEFYLVWTGSGDDVLGSPITIAGGDLLQFVLQPGIPSITKEVRFSSLFGDVYIHEGYAKWDNAGMGDHISAVVVADPTLLQTLANLDLEIVNNWVKFATGGAGTGTHGFAANPTLIKRSKSKDGDWDYDTTNGLVPNLSGTGEYKISDIEREVHKYINKIPTFGNSYGYTRLTSDETAELPVGYFLRITTHNISDTAWTSCIFLEVFREQTATP